MILSEVIAELTLEKQAQSVYRLTLRMAKACMESDTIYGNLLRYHSVTDPDVLDFMDNQAEQNNATGKVILNDTCLLNVIAAADIVRKMFASTEAYDAVMRGMSIEGKVNANVQHNVISFCDYIIKKLAECETVKSEIDELLENLERTIYPC